MLPLLLLCSTGLAQDYAEVWVEASTPRERHSLKAAGFGFVEQQKDQWYLVHGPPEQLSALTDSGLIWRQSRSMNTATERPYASANDVNETLWRWHDENPAITQIVSLGSSRSGVPILALGVGNMTNPRLQWRILGTHHGDEAASTLVAMHTAEELLAYLEDGASPAHFLEQDIVWIVPMVNPDGYNVHSRYNSAGVDLNRNYEYEWSETEWAAGAYPFSEPETRAVRTMSDWSSFGAGLSLHSGAANLGWVWNFTTEMTADAPWLEELAAQYADLCTIENFWITNGADWYITNGDTNDWSYGRHGMFDFTLEVSVEKSPPADDWNQIESGHSVPIIEFLQPESVIFGTVTDEVTGQGLPASISFNDQPIELATDNSGRFGRPVPPEQHSVRVSAPGYAPQERSISPDDEGVHISLTPAHLLELTVSPGILSQTSGGTFVLDRDVQEVSLTRPGHPNTHATATQKGWYVPIQNLTPGPWNIVTDQGVSPRAIFVGERDSNVEILSAEIVESGLIRLTGHGFGAGSQAWALYGQARNPIPLPSMTDEPELLEFEITLPDSESEIDVWIISNGYQLAVRNLPGTAILDTGEPSVSDSGGTMADTGGQNMGETDGESGPTLSGCACTTPGRHFPTGGLAVSLGVLGFANRRRACKPIRSTTP